MRFQATPTEQRHSLLGPEQAALPGHERVQGAQGVRAGVDADATAGRQGQHGRTELPGGPAEPFESHGQVQGGANLVSKNLIV